MKPNAKGAKISRIVTAIELIGLSFWPRSTQPGIEWLPNRFEAAIKRMPGARCRALRANIQVSRYKPDYTADANGLPGAPLVGVDHHTIPFFASGNVSGNTDYNAGGPNIKNVSLNSGDQVWAYFGCFLNLYDSGNVIDGQNVQHWLNGAIIASWRKSLTTMRPS
jgi:hypothetical protein